ncbi:MAG: PDZ domain-containing protein [Crenarchaeota archaeon]|nr:MAG: PDZ domain-containing protein [Thermoproteota archaeon]RDJ33469.1 MAG: PDZ domain-containing protein [Thermoproteota archaeon]RDJ36129.1 MAG: PDZ domain-containing protein [Thermoproteota archaeon]RDJ38761.1 MAG: PDZ domain-containing protein [Thermoproteota archaeon]
MAWVVIVLVAKGLKLEKHGFEIKAYSLVYKNKGVQSVLTKMLSRTRRGIRVFADVSVISGFIMMGFAFWFLLSNISKFFVAPTEFAEVTVLIPGITLTSSASITYFLLSIPIVLVIHEGAHGIVATLEKIKIKTGGFAIFIAMFAGFVEPDEEEFDKAKKISKLRVIGAGATSNVIFALVLGAILLTNPLFAIVLPEPILGAFYDAPEGVMVLSLIDGLGAEKAGIQPNDIITAINDQRILTPIDFQNIELKSGETVTVSVLRDGNELQIPVEIMPSPEDPERGLIGIMRDNSFAYKPVYNFIEWNNPQLSMFLLWLWMISFFIGIINMLPLPILDGGKFIHSIIDKKISDKSVNIMMWSIYGFTFILFGLNIGLSYFKSGWFTI